MEPLNDTEFNLLTWNIIQSYFRVYQTEAIVRYTTESMNDFLNRKLLQIIDGFNPIHIYDKHDQVKDIHEYQLTLHVRNPVLMEPRIHERDGSTSLMTPFDARQRHFTYASTLCVDVHVMASVYKDGQIETTEKTLYAVNIGKIPIMVKSNYCILKEPNYSRHGEECRLDPGGYMIINGSEKCIISQDRISENKTYVFLDTKGTVYSHIAEIRSVPQNTFGPPKLTSVKLSAKAHTLGYYIRVGMHHIRHDIPLFILFRALGITTDKDIVDHIVYDLSTPTGQLLAEQLRGSIDEAATITTPNAALDYMSRYLNITGYPREWLLNRDRRINIIHETLTKEFMPHVGDSYAKKALYLGYMVNKLLQCSLGLQPLDDRDSYINKRVDTPGVLVANLFRQYYGKLIRDMKTLIYREIKSGPWKATNQFINVVNANNIYKLMKSTTIESGMKYSLATGNWGIRSNKTKQGVAQVLNRLTYNATLSHLRRVNTPMEKTGKLVQPRKLHPTQFGIMCPAETPEGSSVGLVKNLAVMTHVTISVDTHLIRQLLVDNGTRMYEELPPTTEALDATHTMAPLSMFSVHTHIIINGELVGVHENPAALYAVMKEAKRAGQIHVYTGIVWNMRERTMSFCTDGGRCVRPLYVVRDGRCPLTRDIVRGVTNGELGWNDLMSPVALTPAQREEYGLLDGGIIEYLDVEEANHAFIAMTPQALREAAPSDRVRYTHMEIHPALILGSIASTIPFPDHNQAPRNTYQCLHPDETVLMADNTTKSLRDIRVGEMVYTVDPRTLEITTAPVVGQFIQPATVDVYKLVFTNGHSIIATEDHKFLTIDTTGTPVWMETGAMTPGVRIHTLSMTGNVESTIAHVVASLERLKERCDVADIEVGHENHSFITTYGLSSGNCAMGKQAVGIHTLNFRDRMDTLANVLNYSQRPLTTTRMSELLHCNEMPSGVNVILAIATFTGYNQEDSVIMNQSAVDRGMFNSTYYRTYKETLIKNHGTGVEEIFYRPPMTQTKGLKPFNYDKLADDGFVPENTHVEDGDILIGKCMPQKAGETFLYKDNSIVVKHNENGYVDRNASHDRYFKNVNSEGYVFGKVRVRSNRIPVIGDKVASRSAQKGTIGMLYRQEDMPFSASGLVPDIIMNPHAIPSRMTIGQMIETIMGKACCSLGTYGDATPFNDLSVEDIARVLDGCGFERYGDEILYDPRTGAQMPTAIFVGPTYYQRLKHMTADKIHSRSSNGPVVLMTRQPAEGRAREGGLRLGEMEVECNWAHGALHFLKERLMECSDNYRVFICNQCGMIATVNPEKRIYKCDPCKNYTSFQQIRIPYAAKLLFQEIQAMGIGTKFLTR